MSPADKVKILDVPALDAVQVHHWVSRLLNREGPKLTQLATWLFEHSHGNPAKMADGIKLLQQHQALWLEPDQLQ